MIFIMIRVRPGSFKDEIAIDGSGMWHIKIRERPTEGAANAYLVEFLAKEFHLSKSDIIIDKGANSRFKKILLNIDGPALDRIISRYKK